MLYVNWLEMICFNREAAQRLSEDADEHLFANHSLDKFDIALKIAAELEKSEPGASNRF